MRYNSKKDMYLNKHFYTKFGNEFVVIDYKDNDAVYIEFPFSGYKAKTSVSSIDKGIVADPFVNYSTNKHKPFICQNKFDELKYNIYVNRYGEKFKVIKYKNDRNVTVQFIDHPDYIVTTCFSNIKHKSIKSPYVKNKMGGYLGTDMTYRNREYAWLDNKWREMLARASEINRLNSKRNIPYENCFICDEWYCYGNFAMDYMNKYKKLNPEFDYILDKDLLYPLYKEKTNGRKLYSNETTVLLPAYINYSLGRLQDCNFKSSKIKYHYDNYYNRISIFNSKVQFYYDNGGLDQLSYDLLVQVGGDYILRLNESFKEIL